MAKSYSQPINLPSSCPLVPLPPLPGRRRLLIETTFIWGSGVWSKECDICQFCACSYYFCQFHFTPVLLSVTFLFVLLYAFIFFRGVLLSNLCLFSFILASSSLKTVQWLIRRPDEEGLSASLIKHWSSMKDYIKDVSVPPIFLFEHFFRVV